MKNPLCLLLLLSSLFFTACSDDDDAVVESAAANLPNKQWVFTEIKVKAFLTEEDALADFDECDKDNLMEFREERVLIVDEGPSKCSPDDPQQTEGTWNVQGETLVITGLDLGLDDSSLQIKITETTSSTLKGTFEESIQGFPVMGRLTLSVK